ncbi:MAG: tRNA uridine-5-carboxymethylaminomethyl(34) synthesis enzyme MnmG [Planctomycetales bacterium 4572_13]|nr:MAG: tRNA uridine-5-carboxymethylaminomethyl(34) synthesis enzyme MnmG [Planctomycetales bacterium 4572_13]
MADGYQYDMIVVGGGHAGVEAAWAGSKMGARVLLLTMSRETIAKMSCNPAIGGLAKGQIVREIDALGGLMGEAIDATGIQFRMLNLSKGPAVQSPRAQADKYLYKAYVRGRLEEADNLVIEEGIAAEVLVGDGSAWTHLQHGQAELDRATRGVVCTDGREFYAPCVVLTTGTFLKGVMHRGDAQWEGGRLDEPASNELSDNLRTLGLTVERLKTGTPARLDGATLDYDKLECQPGDEQPRPFSFLNDRIDRPHRPCWITWTNEKIHKLLRDNMAVAPLYSGQIESTGPRYCPSIETKIVRFADKKRHQVFLEPEDEDMTTIYCNGISTSYPKDIQDEMIRLMAGTENARIVEYAYAIEYDYCPAQQLRPNLETKGVPGLFLAGQINGTSGYEEAAGQGLLAGVNAARKLNHAEPLILGRDQAYIGVLVDDLLTREIDEPYRMFTSRAEYRLALRSDNADRRLTQIGRSVGIVGDIRWSRFEKKLDEMKRLEVFLKSTRKDGKPLWQTIKQPQHPLSQDISIDADVMGLGVSKEVMDAVRIEAKYEGYTARQEKQIGAFRKLENVKLPESLDYHAIPHLRFEAREKLTTFRPFTLGQASRIGGVTPADITVIQIYLKKNRQ